MSLSFHVPLFPSSLLPLSRSPSLSSIELNGNDEALDRHIETKIKARIVTMAWRFQGSLLSSQSWFSLLQVLRSPPPLNKSMNQVYIFPFLFFSFFEILWWQVKNAVGSNWAVFSFEWFYFLRKVKLTLSLHI